MGTGADSQMLLRRTDPEVFEEHVRQHRVVVLSRVNYHVIDAAGTQLLVDGGQQNEQGAGPNNTK